MVDKLFDIRGTEQKPKNYWPERYLMKDKDIELEEALRSIIDWGIINLLRADFEFPVEILELSPDELTQKYSLREIGNAIEIQKIIDEWNIDPEKFVNPFKKSQFEMKMIDEPPSDRIGSEEI